MKAEDDEGQEAKDDDAKSLQEEDIVAGEKELSKDDETKNEAAEDVTGGFVLADDSDSGKPKEDGDEKSEAPNLAQSKLEESTLPISLTISPNVDQEGQTLEEKVLDERPKLKTEGRERNNRNHARNNSKTNTSSVQARLDALNKNVISKN